MAHVHLATVVPCPWGFEEADAHALIDRVRESQRRDRFGVHTLTDDPDAADVILFLCPLGLGPIFLRQLAHPLVRRHRRKCYLYDPNDRIVPVLPGIFPSVERSRQPLSRVRGGAYLLAKDNPFLDETHDAPTPRTYLYSFVGSYTTAPVRRQLATLTHPRGFCADSYPAMCQLMQGAGEAAALEFRRRYVETSWASDFVLCPRGFGASSIRLFETMRLGRAPVILSDEWVPPDGPCWERFSLRIPEADWASVPQRLELRAADAATMGRLAREQWEEWFAPAVLFHRLVEDCLSIARAPQTLPEPLASWVVYPQILRPSHLRHWARQTGVAQRLKAILRMGKAEGRRQEAEGKDH